MVKHSSRGFGSPLLTLGTATPMVIDALARPDRSQMTAIRRGLGGRVHVESPSPSRVASSRGIDLDSGHVVGLRGWLKVEREMDHVRIEVPV